jgi:hypothetical protein
MASAIQAAGRLDPEACRSTARDRFEVGKMIAAYFDRYRQLARSAA